MRSSLAVLFAAAAPVICAALAIAQVPDGTSNAVALIRGPYLQRGSATNIAIRWRTDQPAVSQVRYGTDPADLGFISADLTPKTNHQVVLPDLQPDTRYFYSIQTSDTTLAGGDSFFLLTAPTGSKPTRVWVLGDSGTRTAGQFAVRDAYYNYTGEHHTDLWLMLGDNAYSVGFDHIYQAAVFDVYPDMLRKSVLWPAIGNHEITGADLSDFPYLHIFTLPNNGEAGGVPSDTSKYYSFQYGNIHFVCLDSETSQRTAGSAMLQWLERDLTVNTALWTIAYWHSPPYSKGGHDSDLNIEEIEMRQNAVPILENHGADLVLCGHSHSYERSFLLDGHYGTADTFQPAMRLNPGDGRLDGSGPYYKGQNSHSGTVYVVAGCSGQIDGGPLDHPAMFISLNLLGSVVLDIDGGVLNAQFLTSDGVIADHFTIIKGPAPQNFLVRSIVMTGPMATLTWTSMPGHYYRVFFSESINPATWVPLAEPFRASDSTASWTGSIPANKTNGFFKISLQID